MCQMAVNRACKCFSHVSDKDGAMMSGCCGRRCVHWKDYLDYQWRSGKAVQGDESWPELQDASINYTQTMQHQITERF